MRSNLAILEIFRERINKIQHYSGKNPPTLEEIDEAFFKLYNCGLLTAYEICAILNHNDGIRKDKFNG